MRLAEALIERADLKQQLYALQTRLVNNAKVQEGLTPNEDPQALLKELDEKTSRYEYLIEHINKTNSSATGASGETISQLIAKRDVLTEKLKILKNFIESGSSLISRLSHSEIRTLTTFSVVEEQKKADKIAAEIRKIDSNVQELNWTTDLM